jgi:hypothetical protein
MVNEKRKAEIKDIIRTIWRQVLALVCVMGAWVLFNLVLILINAIRWKF